jgi:hypothetical protein
VEVDTVICGDCHDQILGIDRDLHYCWLHICFNNLLGNEWIRLSESFPLLPKRIERAIIHDLEELGYVVSYEAGKALYVRPTYSYFNDMKIFCACTKYEENEDDDD